MKVSEVFKIAQHCVLEQMPVDTWEQRENVLYALSVLKKEEEMAAYLENVGEKENV